jgi:FkbM family methyltransferase
MGERPLFEIPLPDLRLRARQAIRGGDRREIRAKRRHRSLPLRSGSSIQIGEDLHSRSGQFDVSKRAEAEEIRIVDAKQWFDENGIESVALMKINIEGGEYDLLDRMIQTRLVESIENIQVQFHNFTVNATRRMEHIQKDLERTHTSTYQYRFVWENWARNGDA